MSYYYGPGTLDQPFGPTTVTDMDRKGYPNPPHHQYTEQMDRNHITNYNIQPQYVQQNNFLQPKYTTHNVQQKSPYTSHAKSPLLENSQDLYGTYSGHDYKTNDAYYYENVSPTQSNLYFNSDDRKVLSPQQSQYNLDTKVYKQDLGEEYVQRNFMSERQNSGVLQPSVQSETEAFCRSYNEIQKMKMKQQIHYQTQAQLQQQQTFAQRQLLLQQLHGVQPPSNLPNLQENEISSISTQSPLSPNYWQQSNEMKSPSKTSEDSSSPSRVRGLRSPVANRLPNARVSMVGFLYKQGSDGLKVWRKRWFVLADYCLFYYKNQEEERLLGSILLPSYKISICTSDDKVMRKYSFKCEHANMRTYYLAASTEEEMHKWVRSLKAASLMQDINDLDEQEYKKINIEFQSPNFKQQAQPQENTPRSSGYVNAPPKPRRYNECISPSQEIYGMNSPKHQSMNNDYRQYPPLPAKQPTSWVPQSSEVQKENEIMYRHSNLERQHDLQQQNVMEQNRHVISNVNPIRQSNLNVDPSRKSVSHLDPTRNSISNLEQHKQALSNLEQTRQSLEQTRQSISNLEQHRQSVSNLEQTRLSMEQTRQAISNLEREKHKIYGQNDYNVEKHSQVAYSKPSDRRTPEAYGNFSMPYENRKAGNYEDVYLDSSRQYDGSGLYDNNRLQHTAVQQPSSGGPAILRKKKMLAEKVPRPQSADFLEYENQQQRSTRMQPERPKSSLNINSPLDPSSDSYYTEQSYAEKMRQLTKYLPRNEMEKKILSNISQDESYAADYTNDMKDSNWTLKEKPLDYINRAEDDSFLRSASARLPGKPVQKEDEKKHQQREESMKRLLEWKQRMLQSPLTRKSTPASISLGVAMKHKSELSLNKSSTYSSDDEEHIVTEHHSCETQAERSNTHLTLDSNNIVNHTPAQAHVNTTENNYENINVEHNTEEMKNDDTEKDLEKTEVEEEVVDIENEDENTVYTDDDLDEELSAIDTEEHTNAPENKEDHCSSPVPMANEDHYLPMSPRKVSVTSDTQQPLVSVKPSVFSDDIHQIYTEDCPYVEMKSESESGVNDEMQTYEVVCVNNEKENVYMELCNFLSGDKGKKTGSVFDSDDKKSKSIRSGKNSLPLPDIIHSTESIGTLKKNKEKKIDEESLKQIDTEKFIKRLSISDSFRPASYYLSNSKSSLTLEIENKLNTSTSEISTSENMSISSSDRFDSNSSFSDLRSNKLDLTKKKPTSLMISGSRPSMHDTIFRGEKIRKSRAEMLQDRKSSPVILKKSVQLHSVDSDSLSTYAEGRASSINSLSSKCDSFSSNFPSETTSLNDCDDISKLKASNSKVEMSVNDHFGSDEIFYDAESFDSSAIDTLVKKGKTISINIDSSWLMKNESPAYPEHNIDTNHNTEKLNHPKLTISHARSVSLPVESKSSSMMPIISRILNENEKAQDDMSYLNKNLSNNESAINKNLNKESYDDKLADDDKCIKKTQIDSRKSENEIMPCHCRSSSADQPAPYYYSDLSNIHGCAKTKNHFIKNNNIASKKLNNHRHDITSRKNEISQRNRGNIINGSKSLSVEFLSNIDKNTDESNGLIETSKQSSCKSNMNNAEPTTSKAYQGDKIWDEDVLWRDNLRRASRYHARSVDGLDIISNSEGDTSKDESGVDVPDGLKLESSSNTDDNDVYVSLARNDDGVMVKNDYDDGAYEQLIIGETNPDIINSNPNSESVLRIIDDKEIIDEPPYEALRKSATLVHHSDLEQKLKKSSTSRTVRDNNIPIRAVSPRVRWDSNKLSEQQRPQQGSQQIGGMNISDWNLSNFDSVKAGDLLGRSHEELVVLLVLLRKNQNEKQQGVQQCQAQISNLQDRLSYLDKYSLDREYNLRRLEQLKLQLIELEHQYEKSKPLLNLVDNMVKLGSLYNKSDAVPNTIDRIERNHLMRQKVLTDQAEEIKRGTNELNTEIRVQQLRLLEQQLNEEAATLADIKNDRPFITSLLNDMNTDVTPELSPTRSDNDLEEELAKVHQMLAINSQKLEQTVHANTRLENALSALRRRLPKSEHNTHTSHAHAVTALHQELSRVQSLVLELQRQRRELSAAVSTLTQRSNALTINDHSNNVINDSSGTWMETDPDSSELNNISAASNMINEKPEVRTVRTVKRESERRQRDRERLYSTTDWMNADEYITRYTNLNEPLSYNTDYPPNDEYMKYSDDIIKKYTTEDMIKKYSTDYSSKHKSHYRHYSNNSSEAMRNYETDKSDDVLRNYTDKSDILLRNYSNDKSEVQLRNYNNRSDSLSRNYPDSNDLLTKNYLSVKSDALFRNYNDKSDVSLRNYTDKCDISSRNYSNESIGTSGWRNNDHQTFNSKLTLDTNVGVSAGAELSPIFKSEAAKQIITEMSDESVYRRAVPKVKRRHYTAPSHHLSTNALNDSPKESSISMGRSLDDADLARAVRSNASIEKLLAAPQKITIPERYIPENTPELSPEEMKKRLEKVESIKKMLSSTPADSGTSPDGEEKRQREHLLQMNQILAQQVMQMSKIVAVKAMLEPPSVDEYDQMYEERSPEVEMPVYQQRENYFT